MSNPDHSAPRTPDSATPAAPLRLDGAFERQTHAIWRQAAEASLGDGTTLDALARHTLDGLRIETLYDESPVEGRCTPTHTPPPGAVAGPDEEPGARARCENRLRVLGGDAASANAHALGGLAGGVDSLEFDVSGSADALPLSQLDGALRDVHPQMVTLSLRVGESGGRAFDALLALYRARGLDPHSMHAALDVDPLGTLARAGHPGTADADSAERWLEAALRELAALAGRAADTLPLARVVSVDLSVHHEAGASAVQELVAGIASATLYLETMLAAGLPAETACRTLVFRVGLDADLIEGVVKLRALERLWRHVLIGCDLPARAPIIVAETSRRHLSRRAPWLNHLRNVSAGTAAMIGGAGTLIVHPHDRIDGQRLDDPGEVADRVARNLVPILADESGLTDVADAAGGAYAIESLTQQMTEAAWRGLGALQDEGGLLAALLGGGWQAALARTHAERVARLDDGRAVKVGVNRFGEDGHDGGGQGGNGQGGNDQGGNGRNDGATIIPLRPVREATPFETPETRA